MPFFIQLLLAFTLGGVIIGTVVSDEWDVALMKSLMVVSSVWFVAVIITASAATEDGRAVPSALWSTAFALVSFLANRAMVARDKRLRRKTK